MMKKLVMAMVVLLAAGFAAASDSEKKGFMGVTLHTVERHDGNTEKVGIFVDEVLPGTAAEAAGLKARDKIIEANGAPVSGIHDLHRVLADTRPNDALDVTVLRDGIEQTLTLVLGEQPEHDHERWAVVLDEKRAYLGVHIDNLNPQLAKYFDVEHGLLITEVIEEGPSHKAGLQAGDIIVEVEGNLIDGRDALHRVMAEVEPGDEIAVLVQRKGVPRTLFVEAGSHEGHTMNIDLKKLHEMKGQYLIEREIHREHDDQAVEEDPKKD